MWAVSAGCGTQAYEARMSQGLANLRAENAGGGSSPEMTWQKFQEGVNAQQWKQVYGTLTPTSQGMLVQQITYAAGGKVRQDRQLTNMLSRHGVNVQVFTMRVFQRNNEVGEVGGGKARAMRLATKEVKNQRQLLVDLLEYFTQKGTVSALLENQDLPLDPQATLVNVQSDGNVATGQLVQAGDQIPVSFRRTVGLWYLDFGSTDVLREGVPGPQMAPDRPTRQDGNHTR